MNEGQRNQLDKQCVVLQINCGGVRTHTCTIFLSGGINFKLILVVGKVSGDMNFNRKIILEMKT